MSSSRKNKGDGDSEEDHSQKLAELKGLLAEEHGEEIVSKMRDLEESGLIRFLKARKWDVAAAAKMAHKYMVFRKKYNVDNITRESVDDELKTGKAFLHGFDKEGRPCVVVQLRYHDGHDRDLNTLIKFIFFTFEAAIARMGDGVEQLVIIYDRTGMTRKNFDMGVVKLLVELAGILQDFYAERLAQFFVLNANWFYYFMWKAVSLIIDSHTAAKFHILDNADTLKEHFESSQLLKIHGGTSEFEFAHPDSVAWPPLENYATKPASSGVDQDKMDAAASKSPKWRWGRKSRQSQESVKSTSSQQ